MNPGNDNFARQFDQHVVNDNDRVIEETPLGFPGEWRINSLVVYLGNLYLLTKMYGFKDAYGSDRYRTYVTISPLQVHHRDASDITVGLRSIKLVVPKSFMVFEDFQHAREFDDGERIGEMMLKNKDDVRSYLHGNFNTSVRYSLVRTPSERIPADSIELSVRRAADDLLRFPLGHMVSMQQYEDKEAQYPGSNVSIGDHAARRAAYESDIEERERNDEREDTERASIEWDFKATTLTSQGWRIGLLVAYDEGIYTVIALRKQSLLLMRMHGHHTDSIREASMSLCRFVIPKSIYAWENPYDAVRMQPGSTVSMMSAPPFPVIRDMLYTNAIPDRIRYKLHSNGLFVMRRPNLKYYLMKRSEVHDYDCSDYPSDGIENNFEEYEQSRPSSEVRDWKRQLRKDLPIINQRILTRSRLNDGMDDDDGTWETQNRSRIYQHQVASEKWLSQMQEVHQLQGLDRQDDGQDHPMREESDEGE